MEEIQKKIRGSFIIFVMLLSLTIITATVSMLDLAGSATIAVIFLIALIQGALILGHSMHLLSEKKLIYIVLALTAGFLIAIPALTLLAFNDVVKV